MRYWSKKLDEVLRGLVARRYADIEPGFEGRRAVRRSTYTQHEGRLPYMQYPRACTLPTPYMH
jgi:hypothetical protein